MRLPGFIRRAIRRQKTITRSGIDAASAGRRWSTSGWLGEGATAIAKDRQRAADVTRYYAVNSGLGARAVDVLTSGLISGGPRVLSDHPDEGVRQLLNQQWHQFENEADADGRQSFGGLLRTMVRTLIIDGEMLAVTPLNADGKLVVRVLPSDRLDASKNAELPGGGRIVSGVEFRPDGPVQAHWIRPDPGPMRSPMSIRIDADETLHGFRHDFAGQVRGLSFLTPALARIRSLDTLHDGQLARQLAGAMLAAFVIDPNGGTGSFEGDQDNGELLAALEPGTVQKLLPGEDVRFSDPPRIGQDAIEFIRLVQREIASAVGVPFSMLASDYTDASYSSARSELVEFRQYLSTLQKSVITRQILEPLWRRWVRTEWLAGRVELPQFGNDPTPFYRVRAVFPKTVWVDPLKDAEAEVLAINRGLMSRREAVAARGRDVEMLDREIAEDKARAEALGLDFSGKPMGATDG